MKTRAARQAAAKLSDPPAAAAKNGFSLISPAKLRQLHATMLKCSAIMERSNALPKRRSVSGEAVAAGVAIDLRAGDWILPPPGDLIARYVKGAPLQALFSTGRSGRGHQDSNVDTFNIVSSSPRTSEQLNIAIGIALANKGKNSGNIVVAFTGTDLRNLHPETLKFVAGRSLPVILVIQNLLPERPLPAAKVRKSIDVDASLYSSSIPVIPVDAQDVVAIYRVAHESIQKARQGAGPTIIEATSFPAATTRRNGNLTGDFAENPIAKMQRYLTDKGLFSAAWEKAVIVKFQRELAEAVASSTAARNGKPGSSLANR